MRKSGGKYQHPCLIASSQSKHSWHPSLFLSSPTTAAISPLVMRLSSDNPLYVSSDNCLSLFLVLSPMDRSRFHSGFKIGFWWRSNSRSLSIRVLQNLHWGWCQWCLCWLFLYREMGLWCVCFDIFFIRVNFLNLN